MPKFDHPEVYIEEVPTGVRSIEGVATSITAFAGWTPEGPTDRAPLISNWSEYEQCFGGFNTRSLLPYSVHRFFNNGGKKAYIVRVTADDHSVVLQPNTSDFESALLPSSFDRGLYLLDNVDLFNLLCVPGETTPVIIAELQKFCRDRRAFLIADCDQTATVPSLQDGPDPTITDEDGVNAAFYFPWISAPDPLQENRPMSLPPCGFVAGIYAKTDEKRGVWKAPAGEDAGLVGVTGVTVALTDSENEMLNQQGINCIRSFPVSGTVVWGARTLLGNDQSGSEWKYVPVRRLALFLEESLYRGTQWVAFEPNDETFWAKIRFSVGAFMLNLFRQGAFQAANPQEAYFVKCDKETTTQADIDQGIVNIQVGFAPLRPAEFVVINISQIVGH